MVAYSSDHGRAKPATQSLITDAGSTPHTKAPPGAVRTVLAPHPRRTANI